MYDFAVQFFDFSPEDLEHVQLSFSFNVKAVLISVYKRKKKIIFKNYL
jgi:hypothetical protein